MKKIFFVICLLLILGDTAYGQQFNCFIGVIDTPALVREVMAEFEGSLLEQKQPQENAEKGMKYYRRIMELQKLIYDVTYNQVIKPKLPPNGCFLIIEKGAVPMLSKRVLLLNDEIKEALKSKKLEIKLLLHKDE